MAYLPRILLATAWGAFYFAWGYALNVPLFANELEWWSTGLGLGLTAMAAGVAFVYVLLNPDA
jgi:hypothetical protein